MSISTHPPTRVLAERYVTIMSSIFARKKLSGKIVQGTRGIRHLTLEVVLSDALTLSNLLDAKTTDAIALATRTQSVLAYRQAGRVRLLFQLPESMWQTCVFSDTTGLGVGLGDSRKQIEYEFQPPHTLVAGTSGSGKSVTLSAITLAAVREHTRTNEELKLVIIDPHQDLADFENSSSLVMPIATTDKEIVRALQWTKGEYLRRKQHNLRNEPRVLVVVDEADESLFGAGVEIMRTITSKCRKFRINVVLATQKPSDKTLPDILPNLAQRYIGLVTDARVSATLTGHPGLKAHMLAGEGDFIRVAGGSGRFSNNTKGASRFQVAYIQPSDFRDLPRGTNFDPTLLQRAAEVPIEDNGIPPDPPDDFHHRSTDTDWYFDELAETGRPQKQIRINILAYYLAVGPNNVSISFAQQQLSVSKRGHSKYKQLASEIKAEATLIHAKQQRSRRSRTH